ncbi:hypothetical protein [Alishewanella sp. SMS8]|uniref:hypothetical protein n=1 Tax=Alishewanella sp. SMS8 TaxID=2994676 RepID=UPI002741A522|nr:hypothetical protein [Alishewanella sp. SMS8]MDP5458547.1 hypothetical protein [Alishewanella sp. SMS8]
MFVVQQFDYSDGAAISSGFLNKPRGEVAVCHPIKNVFAVGEVLSFVSPKESTQRKFDPRCGESPFNFARPRRRGNSLGATAPHSNTPRLKTLVEQT